MPTITPSVEVSFIVMKSLVGQGFYRTFEEGSCNSFGSENKGCVVRLTSSVKGFCIQ